MKRIYNNANLRMASLVSVLTLMLTLSSCNIDEDGATPRPERVGWHIANAAALAFVDIHYALQDVLSFERMMLIEDEALWEEYRAEHFTNIDRVVVDNNEYVICYHSRYSSTTTTITTDGRTLSEGGTWDIETPGYCRLKVIATDAGYRLSITSLDSLSSDYDNTTLSGEIDAELLPGTDIVRYSNARELVILDPYWRYGEIDEQLSCYLYIDVVEPIEFNTPERWTDGGLFAGSLELISEDGFYGTTDSVSLTFDGSGKRGVYHYLDYTESIDITIGPYRPRNSVVFR